MTEMLEWIVAGAAGFGIGLSKGLLPGLKKKASGESCTDHEKRLSRVEAAVKVFAQELSKGSARFQKLESLISRIDKNVAVLRDRDDRKGEVGSYGDR